MLSLLFSAVLKYTNSFSSAEHWEKWNKRLTFHPKTPHFCDCGGFALASRQPHSHPHMGVPHAVFLSPHPHQGFALSYIPSLRSPQPSCWVQLGPPRTLWNVSKPSGTMQNVPEPTWTFWNPLECSRAGWDPQVPSGTFCIPLELSGTVWGRQGQPRLPSQWRCHMRTWSGRTLTDILVSLCPAAFRKDVF